jgi:predicted acylesterase/phospholipase RssA
VFGGEVLCRLHELGVMERADFVSGISMGAVAGATYCLSRDEGDTLPGDFVWRREDVEDLMRHGVWLDYFLRYLTNPLNVLRYYATGLNRSYQMRRILDQTYFHDRTLAELNPCRPKLLVTATVLESGAVFTFTDRRLAQLGVRSDVLRIADAVQASASFPGVFHPYVLPQYEPGESGPRITEFVHLVDGGVYDNLGVAPLLRIFRENRERFPRGGVIVVADASLPVEMKEALAHRTDVRSMTDYVVDFSSMLKSLEIMFEVDRLGLMRALREDSLHLGLRVVHLHYTTGLLSEGRDLHDELPNILDLDAAVPTNVDFEGKAHLVAPTALGISEEHARATREAAKRVVEFHLAELRAIAEGR